MPKLTLSLLAKNHYLPSMRISATAYIDCQNEMRITFSGKRITKPWIPSESGEHSEDQTSIQLKRGINPIFLPLIDSEIERNTAPKTILKLIREKTWADDVTFPSALQINNRKQFSSAK